MLRTSLNVSSLAFSSPVVTEQDLVAGLPTSSSFTLSIIFLAAGFLGTALSILFVIPFLGRRTIFLSGLFLLSALQLLIAILDCIPSHPKSIPLTQAILMVIWNFVYDSTLGPITFVIITEVPAANLRAKSIAFTTAVQAVAGIIMTVAIPYLINPDQAGLRGKLGFVFGGLAAAGWLWGWWRVVETRGKTFEEIDGMFVAGSSRDEH